MPKTTLYRAADDDCVSVCYSFAREREHAEAYRDNPGFGGETLYRVRLDLGRVLDLTDEGDEWEALSEIVGEEVQPSRWQYHFASTLTTCTDMAARVAAAGYDWVCFRDDHPEGCVTYVPLTAAAAEAAEEAMTEIE